MKMIPFVEPWGILQPWFTGMWLGCIKKIKCDQLWDYLNFFHTEEATDGVWESRRPNGKVDIKIESKRNHGDGGDMSVVLRIFPCFNPTFFPFKATSSHFTMLVISYCIIKQMRMHVLTPLSLKLWSLILKVDRVLKNKHCFSRPTKRLLVPFILSLSEMHGSDNPGSLGSVVREEGLLKSGNTQPRSTHTLKRWESRALWGSYFAPTTKSIFLYIPYSSQTLWQ